MQTMLGVIKIGGFLPGAFHLLPRFRHHQDVVYTCVISNIYKITVFSLSFMHAHDTSHQKFSLTRMINSGAKSVPKIMKKLNLPESFSKITHLMAPFSGFQKQ